MCTSNPEKNLNRFATYHNWKLSIFKIGIPAKKRDVLKIYIFNHRVKLVLKYYK